MSNTVKVKILSVYAECPHCGSEWEQCDCPNAEYINRELAKNDDNND